MSDDISLQQSLINEMKEVCVIDDESARSFLDFNDWNLEAAIEHYFQGGGRLDFHDLADSNYEDNDAASSLRRRNVPQSTVPTMDSSSVSAQTVAPDRAPWTSWITGLAALPFSFIYYTLVDIATFVLSLIRSRPLSVADAKSDVHNFIAQFKGRYKEAASDVQFYDSSYSEALKECKTSLRFMLVYLHNSSHQSCDRFVRETFLSPTLKQFLQRNNILLWGASVKSEEGYKVSIALREITYPFLGLLCMRNIRMVLVLRHQGEIEADNLVQLLQNAITENIIHLDLMKNERDQRDMDMRIRQEQELDYERALVADRAKLDEKRRIESEKSLAKKLEAENRLLEDRNRKNFEMKKREIANSLPAEPDVSNSIRISIRFSTGDRFERRFTPDDSVELLFNSTFAHELCPMNFSLISSYPRHLLNCAPEWYRQYGAVIDPANLPTFRECGFESSALVLVQDNDA